MEFCDGGQVDNIEYFKKYKLNKHRVTLFFKFELSFKFYTLDLSDVRKVI